MNPKNTLITLVITLNCPDGIGLLARITGFVAAEGGNFL